jgi:hypothetical protein
MLEHAGLLHAAEIFRSATKKQTHKIMSIIVLGAKKSCRDLQRYRGIQQNIGVPTCRSATPAARHNGASDSAEMTLAESRGDRRLAIVADSDVQ